MTEGGVQTGSWNYDELDRVTSATTRYPDDANNPKTVSYAYDRRDLTGVTYPDGKAISYSYYASGNLQSATLNSSWSGSAQTFTIGATEDDGYDPVGRLKKRTAPNGVLSAWSYEPAGRLLEADHSLSGTSLGKFTSTYDPASNRLTMQSTGQGMATISQSFGYDAAHRLTSEVRNGTTTSWSYDAAGNRTQLIDALGTTDYLYDGDGDNRLRSMTRGGQTIGTFEYDANGSMTRRRDALDVGQGLRGRPGVEQVAAQCPGHDRMGRVQPGLEGVCELGLQRRQLCQEGRPIDRPAAAACPGGEDPAGDLEQPLAQWVLVPMVGRAQDDNSSLPSWWGKG
jgi:YD repeat-containing protein